MENRRLKLKNGKRSRRPSCLLNAVRRRGVEVGPVDPEIGILRLDRMDGTTLAVIYNFACVNLILREF